MQQKQAEAVYKYLSDDVFDISVTCIINVTHAHLLL